jgi:hypothetical protein
VPFLLQDQAHQNGGPQIDLRFDSNRFESQKAIDLSIDVLPDVHTESGQYYSVDTSVNLTCANACRGIRGLVITAAMVLRVLLAQLALQVRWHRGKARFRCQHTLRRPNWGRDHDRCCPLVRGKSTRSPCFWLKHRNMLHRGASPHRQLVATAV